ncbi:MAG: tetratricopeptide repeat protein [Candidatus Omnitrophica bacterium]|nr:tetratricopeptide repeat protein [Candidatus Omnitrophota bacterium]
MRERLETIFICLLAFVFSYSTCLAASDAKRNVREANRLYRQGKLDEALQRYNAASVAMPDSDVVNFNIGTAYYKKQDYQKAIEFFTKALTSEDRKLEADSLYNLGNSKYKLGKLKENTDLSGTVALLRESLDYYKRAVELDQKNTDARFNHEFVERELKVLLDKLKQQPSQDKQKEEKQQQEEKEGTCPVGKEKEESAQRNEQQQEKEGQEGQSQQEQKEEEAATAEGAEQEEKNKELSEEEARALLERYGQDEVAPDYTDRRTMGYDREILKDW